MLPNDNNDNESEANWLDYEILTGFTGNSFGRIENFQPIHLFCMFNMNIGFKWNGLL